MNRILKLIKISARNIGQNIIHNIILIIFVISSVFFMNISLSSFRHCMYQNTLVQSSGLYDFYMYAGVPAKQVYYSESGEDMYLAADKYVTNELNDIKNSGVIDNYFSISETNMMLNNESDMEVRMFFGSSDLLKNISFQVIKGKWFDAYSGDSLDEEYVPIVIGYNLKSVYNVGQILNLDGVDEKCIVAGILRPNTLFLHAGTGGSGIDLNNVMRNSDNIIIVAKEPDGYGNSYIIKLSEEENAKAEDIVLGAIADVVDTFSFKNLANQAYQSNLFEIQMQTILAVLALITCIVGMKCGNLLSFIKGRKRMAVYFLCGMDRQTSFWVTTLEGIFKLYVPTLVGLYSFYNYCKKQSFDGFYIDFFNIFFTVVIITIIFAGTLIRTIHIAKNNQELYIVQS